MALINCGECDRMASDQAVACPHCGAPIAKQTATVQMHPAQAMSRNVGFWLGVGIFLFPVIFVWFLLRQGHSTTSRVIGFVWLALMVVAMASGDRPSSKPAPASSSQSQPAKVVAPVEPLLEVSAQQLAQAYDRNTVAADQQFKGKTFKVTGVVDSINTDLFGNPYVTLRGGVNQFMEPQFELDEAHANYAAGLQSGMRISLVCTGRGDVAKTPMSEDCIPAN
ncbi:OB-fold protein [Stutzerimonas chloritidismutans]|uniref:OB-fold protein n=1 Tax=Stutzerimonas chloritidismutans TaxID=203192 RepID=UPI003F13A695